MKRWGNLSSRTAGAALIVSATMVGSAFASSSDQADDMLVALTGQSVVDQSLTGRGYQFTLDTQDAPFWWQLLFHQHQGETTAQAKPAN